MCLNGGGQRRIDGESETFVVGPLQAGGDKAAGSCTQQDAESGMIIPILEAGARTGKSTDDVRAGSGIGDPGDPMYTLQSGKQHAIAFNLRGRDGGSQPEECDVVSLRSSSGGSSRSYVAQMAVRRLTLTECERLQGFADNYTRIMHRGKEAADGPRYKALGNSMAVPVLAWLGERIRKQIQTELVA